MKNVFISDKKIEGADDSISWDWLDEEDEAEYEQLRKEGKLIDIDEEEDKEKSFRGHRGIPGHRGGSLPKDAAGGGEAKKKDRSKIERWEGEDPRLSSKGGRKARIQTDAKGNRTITVAKTGEVLHQTKRSPDAFKKDENGKLVLDKEGGKIAVPGKLTMHDGSPLPKHIQNWNFKIPPGWAEVYVNKDPKGKLWVEGVDSKGRSQPKYSNEHSEKQSKEKQTRVNEDLAPKFKALYKVVDKDATSGKKDIKEMAPCLRMIMSTGIRPTDEDEKGKADKKAFGAITLLGQHVFTGSKKVWVELPAKKGTTYKAEIKDPKIAADLLARKREVGKDGRIFKGVTEASILNYSKNRTGFIVKDYRTLVANNTAKDIMVTMKKPKNETEYVKAVKSVAKQVSQVLCNGPGMAFESYIDKRKWEPWAKGITFEKYGIDLKKKKGFDELMEAIFIELEEE